MQSIEIEFKYAHHTSTTITRENRLKKINRKKKNSSYVWKFVCTSQCKVIPSCRIVLELGEDGR